MKVFACIVLLAALVAAEPPRYRQQSRFFARQEEAPSPDPVEAPYQPSGWRPAGPAFKLPERQVQSSYGAPEPPSVYGPPTTTEVPTTPPAAEETITAAPQTEDAGNELEEEANEQEEQQGEYYIALPDGRLQRVQYVSREDAVSMRYLAKIQAQNVGPIYAYNPLQKLQLVSPVEVEAPVAVVPLSGSGTPLSSSYTTVTTNYQPSAKILLARA